ncbi:V-type ATPase 116 kDa subunit [Tepidanaerobacter acetatoxydans Re1]|uniref:V-type ATPase 116 kDa subunit n=1 Tax=Tepidanaerobacter acetatoxydans (strain DSM 21804 / JCM 16047 / Re1) TaxID=1209989 RepID=F4LVD1_TEPAE|nr:V-type ATPase 116kDa subunit family protein [Tepidanaerobacter acetatoxydans]AEE90706.1 V-type ATPase 116 kDa subunit [Tepidanaerobacter acetatoxydans Re1]CCP25247.1 V-type ATPase 116 kDa subunit [Tepidanaerobacter acetatoxydans Re1]
MAVEKMKIVGVIGENAILNRVLRLVLVDGSMHTVNALARINSSDFFLPPNEKNIKALEELPFLKPNSSKRDFTHDEQMIAALLNLFSMKPYVRLEHLGQDYDYDEFMQGLSDIYDKVCRTADEVDEKLRSIEQKRAYIDSLKYLRQYNFNIDMLSNMKHLSFKLLKLSKENYTKLKKNYENIPAVVLKVAEESKDVIVAVITPIILEETVERIFGSLNYTLLSLPTWISGTAAEAIDELTDSIKEDQDAVEFLKKSLKEYRVKFAEEFEKGFSRLEMEEKIEELKSDIAVGDKLFFMFGFVPISCVPRLENSLKQQFKDAVIVLTDEADASDSIITPPTKLSNSRIFRPFETLVKMYGTPAYNEIDPTVFFSLTYMLLFGAMFGDVGQGLILFLAGTFLEIVMKRTSLGGVLSRVGFASTIFGFIYGSVFGSEEIIEPLVVRPMANINFMLVAAIVLGVFLTIAGYIYNIMNSYIDRNMEEGIFGRNGVVGLAFYLIVLYAVTRTVLVNSGISPVMVYTLICLLLLMVFKQPLANSITHAGKLYSGSPTDYYIEEGFGIIETLLSMMSNTISFIRVGAFALNHVGLYMAFATMGEMIGSAWGNILLLVLGNVIIIGLEGLIVFIQALRLEYYELFTKYFRGDGIEYAPAKIKRKSFNDRKLDTAHSSV